MDFGKIEILLDRLDVAMQRQRRHPFVDDFVEESRGLRIGAGADAQYL
jgi:hypothetical protein